jgi:acetylornithine deacetylase/succinyl-diaminopimelate desuccinylase-like protein
MKARALLPLCAVAVTLSAQTRPTDPDWKAVDVETLRHYQAAVRFDTTAKERPLAEYIKKVFDDNGIPAQILFSEPDRPNVVARLKGYGK